MGCHFLLQGIFPTQGPNPSLLHWQMDFLALSQQGSPIQNPRWKRKENERRCKAIKEKGLVKRLWGLLCWSVLHVSTAGGAGLIRITELRSCMPRGMAKKKKKRIKNKMGEGDLLQVYILKKLWGIISEIRIGLKHLRLMTATYEIQLWQRNQSIRLQ